MRGSGAPPLADLLAEIDTLEAQLPESSEEMAARMHALARLPEAQAGLDQTRASTPMTSEPLT